MLLRANSRKFWVAPRPLSITVCRGQMKCDGICAETRFCLSVKWTSPCKSVEASVQLTTGSQGVRISGSNAEYTMFWGSVKGTGYPLHSPVSTSLPLPCITVCHHISTGVYLISILFMLMKLLYILFWYFFKSWNQIGIYIENGFWFSWWFNFPQLK